MIGFSRNILALRAQRQLDSAQDQIMRSLERLSSGARINRPSDDAAGLAVASSLRANSRVYAQGIRNLNDGISALAIADGATSELSSIITRMRELAIQASNGSFSRTQRLSLDGEATQLTKEYNRIVASTRFNGLNILDGGLASLRIQGGYGVDGSLAFGVGQGLQRSQGNGSFTAAYSQSVGGAGARFAVGDLDGDGDEDIVRTSNIGSVDTLINDGEGNYSQGATFASSSFAVAIVDWNSDGVKDIATYDITAQRLRIFAGSPDPLVSYSQQAQLNLSFTGTNHEVLVGDFNDDGHEDLAVSSDSENQIRVVLNRGAGTFTSNFSAQAAVSANISGSAGEMLIVDLNNDGRLDILDTVGDTDLTAYYGIGSGNIGSATILDDIGGVVTISSASVGDFNHDGLKDIVYDTTLGGSDPVILLGQSSGQFANGGTINLSIAANFEVRVADLNTDGNDDIYISQGSTEYAVWGNGDGTFQSPITIDMGDGAYTQFEFKDVTGDGVLDFVSSDGGRLDVYHAGANQTTNIQRLDLTTRERALEMLALLDEALARVGTERGNLGAAQSRLSLAMSNLFSMRQEGDAASSRISDVDVAKESAESIRLTILQQTATAVLAQANQAPTLALRLLQNS